MTERAHKKTFGQDALGFLFCGIGGFLAVSIVLFTLGQTPKPGLIRVLTWPVVELVLDLGHAGAVVFSLGLAALGTALFLRPAALAPLRPLLACLAGALAVSLVLGAFGQGGQLGAWLPGLLAGAAGRVLSVVLGAALGWVGWILLAEPRGSRSGTADAMARIGLSPRTDAAGVSTAEAALLGSEPRPAPRPVARREEPARPERRTDDSIRPYAPPAAVATPPARVTPLEPPPAPVPLPVDPAAADEAAPPVPSWEEEAHEESLPFLESGADPASGEVDADAAFEPWAEAPGTLEEELAGEDPFASDEEEAEEPGEEEEPEEDRWASAAPEASRDADEADPEADEPEDEEEPELDGAEGEVLELSRGERGTLDPEDEPDELADEPEEELAAEEAPEALAAQPAAEDASPLRPAAWEQAGLFDEPEAPAAATPALDFGAGTEPTPSSEAPLAAEAAPPAQGESPEPAPPPRAESSEDEVKPARKRTRKAAPKAAAPAETEEDFVLEPAAPRGAAPTLERDEEEERFQRLVHEAGLAILEQNRVAVSMLERRFGVDFDQACRILDHLQQAGLIGPYLGGRTREILLSREEWLAREPHAPESL